MESYPKIKAVTILHDRCLLITFMNNITKMYDCKPLLKEENFFSLKDDVLFGCVKKDKSGYGINWNEKVDLSESELWINGILQPN